MNERMILKCILMQLGGFSEYQSSVYYTLLKFKVVREMWEEFNENVAPHFK